MRKNVLPFALAAILLFSGNLYAQKITLGLKGGAAISNQKSGTADNIKTFGSSVTLGAEGGIYGEYKLSKLFSVSAGAEYSPQWGIKENIVSNAYYLTEVKLDYVSLPLLARFNWKKSKRSPLKFYAALGPFVGILIKATPGRSQIPLQYIPPAKSGLSTLNSGLSGFLGISYSFTRNNALFIEGGGNYGILPIQNGNSKGQKYTTAGVVTFGYAYTIQNKYKGRWR